MPDSQNTALQGVNNAFKANTPEQAAAIERLNKSFGYTPTYNVAGNYQASPYQTPSYTPPTGSAMSGQDLIAQYLQNQQNTAQTNYDNFAQQLESAFGQQSQAATREQALRTSTGYNDIQARLNELGAIDRGYQENLTQLDAQMQNGILAQQGTATGELGRQVNLKDLNYNYLQQKNNVNISRSVNNARIALAQGQLATAQQQIENALNIEFKPLQAKIDYLSTFLKMNSDRLSDAQQNRLSYLIQENTKQYNENLQAKKDIYAVLTKAAEHGADALTLQNIQNAKTPEAALAAAGSYMRTGDYQFISGTENQASGYFDKSTGKFVPTGGGGGGGGRPLTILDLQRYTTMYPDAGILPSDTRAQADAKVAMKYGPEGQTRSLIVAAKANNQTYEAVVNEINTDPTVQDKQGAIAIANEVYGKTTTQNSPIEQRIARLKKGGILTDNDIRHALRQQGFTQQQIDSSSLSNLFDTLTSFLFK